MTRYKRCNLRTKTKLIGRSMLAILFSVVFITAATEAQDWTRFRGPDGSGVSEAPAPTEWSPDKNIKWKAKLPGAGVSCPVIVGDKVFLTCYSGYGLDQRDPGEIENLKRHVVCFNRTSGEELWSKTIDAVMPEDVYRGMGVPQHGYASHTPVSDGESLFVFLGKSGVIAYDLDGNEKWKKSVGTGSDPKNWGSAASPIVHKDILVVPAIAESAALFGFNKKTGEEVWKEEVSGYEQSWSTPLVVKVDDKRSDVVIGMPNEIWGLNPANGKMKWLAEGIGGDSFYTSATQLDGVIYASVGGRGGGGSLAVKAGGSKDVSESHVAWKAGIMGSFASPVVYDGHMFVVGRGATIQIVDIENGERVHQGRLASDGAGNSGGGRRGFGQRGSTDYSSPIVAGDKFYYIKANGETFVHTADAEFEQVAVNKTTEDDEVFSGSPAVSNGNLFIRSDKHLYCIGK